MYLPNERYCDTNGYILIYSPNHQRAISSGSFEGYVYEHILVAENLIGRPLLNGEVVHHLDGNRANNSPGNLLILYLSMHSKLHRWMDKNTITPLPQYQDQIDAGCIRCEVCETPIDFGSVYCSKECANIGTVKYEHPTKELLEKLVWEKPTSKIAKDYGVSDVAIAKLCKKYNIDKPGRGYWAHKTY